MKVYKGRGLNQGETYCCSIRDLKDAFGARDINVHFGHIQSSRNAVQNSKERLFKLKGKALILMNMTIRRADVVNRQSLKISSFLCIQIIPVKEVEEVIEEQPVIIEEQQKEVVEPVVQEAIVQRIPDYVISEEPVLQEMSEEPVYVPEVEMDEMPEDIPYENEEQEEVDIEGLLAEYKVEYGKMLDKRMISLIDENTPLEEIDRIKESISSSSRLLTIKANPKFEILMERGLI